MALSLMCPGLSVSKDGSASKQLFRATEPEQENDSRGAAEDAEKQVRKQKGGFTQRRRGAEKQERKNHGVDDTEVAEPRASAEFLAWRRTLPGPQGGPITNKETARRIPAGHQDPTGDPLPCFLVSPRSPRLRVSPLSGSLVSLRLCVSASLREHPFLLPLFPTTRE